MISQGKLLQRLLYHLGSEKIKKEACLPKKHTGTKKGDQEMELINADTGPSQRH